MKLFTTTLAVALLISAGSANARDKIDISYTNNTTKPLTFIYDTAKTDCFYQTDIPSSIVVQPQTTVGPYHGETKGPIFTHCGNSPGDLTIDIQSAAGSTSCQFLQKNVNQLYINPTLCLDASNLPITVNNHSEFGFPRKSWTEIIVGPPKKTARMNQRAVPHAGHEVEHYNTSKVNPMMRNHHIMNHKPMIEKR